MPPTRLLPPTIEASYHCDEQNQKRRNNPESNHFISLFCTIKRTIALRIPEFATECNIIPGTQHCFRPNHSTHTQLLRNHSLLNTEVNAGHYALVTFLGTKLAFDSVWHKNLIVKLHPMSFSTQILRLIFNFLRVRVRGILSSSFNFVAEVPQGSPLLPILYTLFCSDIPSPTTLYTYLSMQMIEPNPSKTQTILFHHPYAGRKLS